MFAIYIWTWTLIFGSTTNNIAQNNVWESRVQPISLHLFHIVLSFKHWKASEGKRKLFNPCLPLHFIWGSIFPSVLSEITPVKEMLFISLWMVFQNWFFVFKEFYPCFTVSHSNLYIKKIRCISILNYLFWITLFSNLGSGSIPQRITELLNIRLYRPFANSLVQYKYTSLVRLFY